jgi:FeS assembly protein IscX
MTKKSQKKLAWADTEELAFRLIDEYPNVDPRRLSHEELFDMVTRLSDFSDKSKPNSSGLDELATTWYSERAEMDDELGALEDVAPEDLDEDDYREDRSFDESDDDDDDDSDTVSLDEVEEDDEDEEEDRF